MTTNPPNPSLRDWQRHLALKRICFGTQREYVNMWSHCNQENILYYYNLQVSYCTDRDNQFLTFLQPKPFNFMQIHKEKLQTSMKNRNKLSQLKHSNITKTIIPYKNIYTSDRKKNTYYMAAWDRNGIY